MQTFKTKKQIADYLGKTRGQIETQIKNNQIKSFKIGKRTHYVIVKDAIIFLIQ